MTVKEVLEEYKEDGYNDYVVTIFQLAFNPRTCKQYHKRMDVSFYGVLDEVVVEDRLISGKNHNLPYDEIQITIGG